MDDPIPFIIYGDGPRLPSGLARIARDLTARLVGLQEELGIRVAQVGVDWPGGWHWQSWDFCGFQPSDRDQGRNAMASVVDELTRETGKRPIILMMMDPSRCYDITRWRGDGSEDPLDALLQADIWGYFPIDAHNPRGGFGGPARKAVMDCKRVLGYGRYGAGVLKTVIGGEAGVPVSYLPHGIETRLFTPGIPLTLAEASFQEWAEKIDLETIKIGCVATNQARKDFGLLFSTLGQLKTMGYDVALWLHTDKLTHIWDVGELVMTSGLRRQDVAVSTEEITDTQLAARYCWSDVTIAPGLGEGFGYPIVESLACGTPVIHGNYAGGVELIPEPSWLVEPSAWRLESLYVVQRPVFHPKAVADAVIAATEQERAIGIDAHRAYCAGAVSYLDWEHLWPRWRSWITKGLQEVRNGSR
jgi:glycosyltransferase involved in cell wall biosynthesis